jgi:hypothetical protein
MLISYTLSGCTASVDEAGEDVREVDAQEASSAAVYDQRYDEFTGEDDPVVFVFSEEKMEDFFYLGWGCTAAQLRLQLNHKYLGGNLAGEVQIQTKFGEEQPSARAYYALATRKATVFSAKETGYITSKAIQSEEFMLRVTDPADGEEITGTFRSDGLNDALNKLPCFPK